MTQTRKWVAATVALVVLILAAGWFLLVSPKRGEAAELRTQREQQIEANDALRAKLEVLREQAKGLPEQRAKLERMLAALPDDPRLPDLIRALTDVGRTSGADLSSIAPGKPVDVTSAVPGAAPAPAPTTGTDPAATGDTATDDVLKSVPLTLEVSGEYAQLERFLNLLEQLDRPLLVSGFTLGPNEQSGTGSSTTSSTTTTSTSGTTASAARGPVKISITGRTYMVGPPAGAVTPGTTTPATGTTTPAPSGQE